MSADNWAVCPKCWSKDPAHLRGEDSDEMKRTLREDYTQGIDQTGEYFLDYHARCTLCDFYWSHKEVLQVFKG